ncbi:MAG: Cof-type HAD-IIB family hydrolase [Treponema sp.]|nr:Cof-type HAD-IIB family hydrolase [Treponema sp.]
MGEYDLIAFDMDGTLLDSSKQIRQDSLKMIDQAVGAGKIVCLSTGRCLPELTVFGEQLSKVSYFICISGALIFDNQKKEILYSADIPPKNILQLFDRINDEDLMLNYFSLESVIEKDKVCRMADFEMGIYQSMFQKICCKVDNIFEHYNSTKEPVYKINLYSKSVEDRELLFPKLTDLDFTFAYSEITSIECSAKGVSKASGLHLLCEKLGIPIERTIAVGDADNGIEILKAAGLAVAMGNANEKVKQIADVIVADNDNGGCAQVISQYLIPHNYSRHKDKNL